MNKTRCAVSLLILFALATISLWHGSTPQQQFYRGLRIVHPPEAAMIRGGGTPVTTICPGRICDDNATEPCTSYFGTKDPCKGVTCQYSYEVSGGPNFEITERRCEVSADQYICEDPEEKNHECTETNAVDDDECRLTGFDTKCGWKVENDCPAPQQDDKGVWGCPNPCFSFIDNGNYCNEGCFPFLM